MGQAWTAAAGVCGTGLYPGSTQACTGFYLQTGELVLSSQVKFTGLYKYL